MKSRTLILSILLATIIVLPACNQKNSEDKKVATLTTSKVDAKKIKEEIVNIIINLPNNSETVKLINETGAAFMAGLTEENLNVNELLTRAQKSKTYGSVLFDLAYTNTYNQVESVTKLLKLHEALTQQLGFQQLNEEQREFQSRYIANKNNRDSIDVIVADLLSSTNDFIQKNGSATDISLVFAGATTKSLQVISTITLFARNNEKLLELFQKQKERVQAAYSILEMTSESDPEVEDMMKMLKPVNEIFSSADPFTIESVEKINKLTSSAG